MFEVKKNEMTLHCMKTHFHVLEKNENINSVIVRGKV